MTLMARSRVKLRMPCALAAAITILAAGPGQGRAQLRPLSPLDWEFLGGPRSFSAGFGVGYLADQRASLAGTRGNLTEFGNFQIAWRSGRVGLEVTGTLVRRFTDNVVLGPPISGSHAPTGEARQDAGDVIASTTVRLIDGARPFHLALRFGTRLPTPSNEAGLDRDRTDFFSTIGGRYQAGVFALTFEGGLGILGTRIDGVDQLDVLAFSAGIESVLGPVTASGLVVGQDDVHRGTTRGNEDLSEIRFGLRTGDIRWLSATAVLGLADYSPSRGILLMVGFRR